MDTYSPTLLVSGAAGRFAGLVIPALRLRGARVRAMVRNPLQAEAVRTRGADEVAVADLRDPDSLDVALKDVDGVFYLGPAFAEDEAAMGCTMVAAAVRNNVRRFVFSSVIQPTNLRLANHTSKLPVEDALFTSGLQYTILHPSNFMQNIVGAWPGVVASSVFAEPFPVTARVARVDYRDVAEVAAIALTGDRLAYGSFELCAEAPDRLAIAEWMSAALQRPVTAAEIGFADWVRKARPPYDTRGLALLEKVQADYAAHGLRGNSLTLQAILGRPPRLVRDLIAELAAQTLFPTV